MNLFTELRLRLLHSENSFTRFTGRIVRYLPVRLKYGNSYVNTQINIRAFEKGAFQVEDYIKENFVRVIRNFNDTEFAKTKNLHLREGAQVSEVPIFQSKDLPKNPIELCPANQKDLELCTTSGSSGRPKVFYLGRDRGPIETAFVHHAWKAAGFNPYHQRAVFRGIDEADSGELFRWNPILQELQISPFILSDDTAPIIWKEISKRKILYIHGYPSTIEVLAKWIGSRPHEFPDRATIRGLLLISEQTFPHQRKIFSEVFPRAKQVSFYGQSEKVAFGFQDERDADLFHFSPIYGFTELLDDSGAQITQAGQVGNLFSTGFLFRGSSFLRYELGDQAELVQAPSIENRYVLSVRNIKSRWESKPIIGSNGRVISLAAVNMHIPELLQFSRVQFIQPEPGKLQLSVVLKSDSVSDDLKLVESKLQRKIGDSLEVAVRRVDQITLNSRGKAKLFVSYLDEKNED